MDKDLEMQNNRHKKGILAGIVGIVVNLIIGCAKLVMGILTGSLAIEVDAINNLGDAACSAGTTLGFKLASKKPDSEHPFGHARIEYIIGILISMAIVIVGVEFSISSVEKIVTPVVDNAINYWALGIMIFSMIAKIALAVFYKMIDKSIGSVALSVSIFDSIQDVLSTAVAIVAMFFPMLDGYVGLFISIIVIFGGIRALIGAMSPILGKNDIKLVSKLTALILEKKDVLSVHHLVLHDYGPGNTIASAHIEVYDTTSLIDAHHLADDIERRVKELTDITLTLHVDPVDTLDKTMVEVSDRARKAISRVNSSISCHDFEYIADNDTYVFDVLVPFSVEISQLDIENALNTEFSQEYKLKFFIERV